MVILEKFRNFSTDKQRKARYLFESIFKEFITPTEISDLSLKTKILDLICYLYQNSTDPFKNNTIPMSQHFESLKEVIKYIEDNLDKKLLSK